MSEANRSEPMADPTDPTLLKPIAVCRMLGVSRSWLYAAAQAGRIPAIRLGGPDGPLRFIPSDLNDWLERARSAWTPGTRGTP
jgi:excisionase family DNA binding protein